MTLNNLVNAFCGRQVSSNPNCKTSFETSNHSDVFACADEDGFVSLFHTQHDDQLRPKFRKRFHHNAIFDVSWVPQQFSIATASGDQTARLWDMSTGKNIQTFKGHSCSLKAISVSKYNHNTLATGSRDGNTLVWDVRQNDATIRIQGTHVIQDCLTPMRKRRKLPTDPGQLGKDSRQTVTSVIFRSEHTIITSGAMDGSIKLWDLRKNYTCKTASSIVKQLPLEVIPYPGQSQRRRGYTCVTIDDTGSEIYASCTDDVIYKYNLSTATPSPNSRCPVSRMYGHYNTSFYVRSSLSLDGKFLLSGSDNNSAYVWRTDTRQETPIARFNAHDMAEVTAVAWSRSDDFTFVTCSDECAIRLWTLPAPEQPEENVDGTADVPEVTLKAPLSTLKKTACSSPRMPHSIVPQSPKVNFQNKENVNSDINIPTDVIGVLKITPQKPNMTSVIHNKSPSTPNQKLRKGNAPMSIDKWVIRTPPLKQLNQTPPPKNNVQTPPLKQMVQTPPPNQNGQITDHNDQTPPPKQSIPKGKMKCKVVKRLDVQMSRTKSTKRKMSTDNSPRASPNKPLVTIKDYFKLSPNKFV